MTLGKFPDLSKLQLSLKSSFLLRDFVTVKWQNVQYNLTRCLTLQKYLNRGGEEILSKDTVDKISLYFLIGLS